MLIIRKLFSLIAMGLTQAIIKLVPGILVESEAWPVRKADNSPPV
jgi:hypothetical protein